MPTYDKDEYSIFREAPVTRSTTTVSERINGICEEYYCAPGLETKTITNARTSLGN